MIPLFRELRPSDLGRMSRCPCESQGRGVGTHSTSGALSCGANHRYSLLVKRSIPILSDGKYTLSSVFCADRFEHRKNILRGMYSQQHIGYLANIIARLSHKSWDRYLRKLKNLRVKHSKLLRSHDRKKTLRKMRELEETLESLRKQGHEARLRRAAAGIHDTYVANPHVVASNVQRVQAPARPRPLQAFEKRPFLASALEEVRLRFTEYNRRFDLAEKHRRYYYPGESAALDSAVAEYGGHTFPDGRTRQSYVLWGTKTLKDARETRIRRVPFVELTDIGDDGLLPESWFDDHLPVGPQGIPRRGDSPYAIRALRRPGPRP